MLKHKMWTKADFSVIVKNWQSMNTSDIAIQLGRTPGSVNGMASLLRKSGIAIPKKRNNGYINTLIADFAKDVKKAKRVSRA